MAHFEQNQENTLFTTPASPPEGVFVKWLMKAAFSRPEDAGGAAVDDRTDSPPWVVPWSTSDGN